MPKSLPGVLKEFKAGELHSGSKTGPIVTSRTQAVAIAINEQKPRRHRMAGSHDGMYITEHHRGVKK